MLNQCWNTALKKLTPASAGSRTRIDFLEGNHANCYTTDADFSGAKKKSAHFLILTCFSSFPTVPLNQIIETLLRISIHFIG